MTHVFYVAYNIYLLTDNNADIHVNEEALRLRAYRQKIKQNDPEKYRDIRNKAIER